MIIIKSVETNRRLPDTIKLFYELFIRDKLSVPETAYFLLLIIIFTTAAIAPIMVNIPTITLNIVRVPP